jgi:competence protein ComEC
MFQLALAFCGGAASLPLLPVLPPPGTLAVGLVAAFACRRRAPALAAGLCGLAWATLSCMAQLADDWSCTRDRQPVALTGVVAAPALRRDGRTDFDFDVRTPSRMRVRLAWYDAPDTPRAGEAWSLTARLRCRRGLVNPGAADRELALLRAGVAATGYVLAGPAPRRLPGRAGRPVERLRERVATGIARSLPDGPSRTVLQGLAVGLRGNIPDDLWDAFAATGVAHLMAISGVHVTGCALFALWVLRRGRRLPGVRRIPRWLAIESGIVVGVTAGYAWLAGASAPALRTLAMVVIAAALRHTRRHWGLDEALALAALCLVAADPLTVTSAGFWLSFVATATLFAAAREAGGATGRVATFVRAQAAIVATLTPVLAAAFGRVSLVAPFANAIAIPLFGGLLLPAVLAGTVLELAAIGAGEPVWRTVAALLDHAWPRLLAMSAWPFADWTPARVPGPLLAAAGVVSFLALCLPLAGLRMAAAAMLVASLAGKPPRVPQDAWSLTVLDVGQGLAAVVETRAHTLVFDTGPRWRGGGAAAEVSLVPYLRARGIRQVDRLVVSHPDQDHAGGVAALVKALPVVASPSCRSGDRWRWDGVEFRVLHPPPGLLASDNDASCALSVAGAGGRALLLADPESRGEAALLGQPVAADVVLLPHHGSLSSSTPELVAAVGARLGIASAAFGNRFGMPQGDVVARWRENGTTVLATADEGAITVQFGGGALAVSTARSERRWWRPVAAP